MTQLKIEELVKDINQPHSNKSTKINNKSNLETMSTETKTEELIKDINQPHSNESTQINNKLNLETMSKELKNEELINSSNQPHGIKTPQTVVEFRENLKKYYWNMGNEGLYVQQIGIPIKYSEISSLNDLYDKVNGGETPCICPKVELIKDIKEHMVETNQSLSCIGLFENSEHFKVIENQFDQENPNWIGIDNQIWREFFYLTLGEFCGYSSQNKNK